MYSPVFFDESHYGVLKEIDIKLSKKVYVCTHIEISKGILSDFDFGDSYLVVDHSFDPIKQSIFERVHFSKINISADKIIIVSPSPDQLFYQEEGLNDYVRVNKKTKTVKKFKHIFCNGMFQKARNMFDPNMVREKNIEKLFLCLSREDKLPRRLLNYNLHKHKIFNHGIVSHQRVAPNVGNLFDVENDLQAFSVRSDFDTNLYMNYGLRKHFVDSYKDKLHAAYNYHEYSELNKKTLIELCVESFTCDYLFITEKTLKPILFKTPFLVMGCPYTLKYLRSLGFKTFDSVFDESYDEQLIVYDRIDGIVSNLKQISSLSLQDTIKKFKITDEICSHNYDVFMKSDWSFNLEEKIERIINVS